MTKWQPRDDKHCRWCQKQYYAYKPLYRDGFCSPKCKQAHYRAYKAYVTTKTGQLSALRSDRKLK